MTMSTETLAGFYSDSYIPAPQPPEPQELSESQGFFSWLRKAVVKVRNWLVETTKKVVQFVTDLVEKTGLGRVFRAIPTTVVTWLRPFALVPLWFPRVWLTIGRVLNWAWNHGPRQLQNVLTRVIWLPLSRLVDRFIARFNISGWAAKIVQRLPWVAELGLWLVIRKGLLLIGIPGLLVGGLMFALVTSGLKYSVDFIYESTLGSRSMAAASVAASAVMLVGIPFGRVFPLWRMLRVLFYAVLPAGGFAQESFLDFWNSFEDESESEPEPEQAAAPVNLVTNPKVAEEAVKALVQPTLVKSKLNPRPKGRHEVWTVEGHDVDVSTVDGFKWRDGVGYDINGNPVAVDLRGDLTRATRDRRRAEFHAQWASAHLAS